MSAATLPTPAPAAPPSTHLTLIEAATPFLTVMDPGMHVLLGGVSWDDYLWLDRQREAKNSGVRLAYADGRLELMTTSFFHDGISERLHGIVVQLGLELDIPYRAGGRTTFRRFDLENGLEADECYYIQNVAAVLTLREIDLSIHPPPDLAVEVDHTRSSLPKQPLYAALRVPELWRFDGTAVSFLVLQPGGGYVEQATSRAFPLVSSADVTRLVLLPPTDDRTYLRAVQAWVRTLVPSQP